MEVLLNDLDRKYTGVYKVKEKGVCRMCHTVYAMAALEG